MKSYTVIALTVVIAAAGALPAEAQRKDARKQRPSPAPLERTYEERDSYDCIRARGLDPAGNYRAYPCWARAALSGRQNR